MKDDYIHENEIERKTPADYLMEKEEDITANDYREAALLYTRVMTLALDYIIHSNNPLIASLGVSYAMGIKPDGLSQRAYAKKIGCSSGTISAHIVNFRKIANIDIKQ
jgi:hypothetical protein